MAVVQEYTMFWNTHGLRADLGLVRDGRWNLLDHEAQQERRASQRKIEWLREHVYTSEPTVKTDVTAVSRNKLVVPPERTG